MDFQPFVVVSVTKMNSMMFQILQKWTEINQMQQISQTTIKMNILINIDYKYKQKK